MSSSPTERIKFLSRVAIDNICFDDVTVDNICFDGRITTDTIKIPVPFGTVIYRYKADTTLLSSDTTNFTSDYY